MDNITNEAIQKAQELLKDGKREQARSILLPIIRADQEIAQAWYLLGFTLTDPAQRLEAFQQVLRIDPANQAAQKQIARLVQTRSTAPAATGDPFSGQPKMEKKPLFASGWGLTGIVLLLICLASVGGWWGWRHGLAALFVPPPSARSSVVANPTPRPTVTPYLRPRPAPSFTPLPPGPGDLRTDPTSNATPNLAAFAVVLTPSVGATVDPSSLSSPETDRISNWQESGHIPPVSLGTGDLGAGEKISIPVDLDGAISDVVFDLAWESKDAPVFRLLSPGPDYYVIDPNYVAAHPDQVSLTINRDVTPSVSSYDLKNPRAGQWKLLITASDAVSYSTEAHFASGLALNCVGDKSAYSGGDIATFVARLEDQGKAVTGVTLNIILQLPDQSKQLIPLKDYGNGVYAAAYAIPDVPGSASAQVTAIGSTGKVNFMRQSSFKFTILPDQITPAGE